MQVCPGNLICEIIPGVFDAAMRIIERFVERHVSNQKRIFYRYQRKFAYMRMRITRIARLASPRFTAEGGPNDRSTHWAEMPDRDGGNRRESSRPARLAMKPWFNVRKAAQVVAFFAQKQGGSINVLKLVKLIYLANRLAMERFVFPLLNDNLVSMDHGPVNSLTFDYINGYHDRAAWKEFVTD